MKKSLVIVGVTLLLVSSIFAQSRDYSILQNALVKFYGYQRAGLKSGSCYNLNTNFTNASHNGDNYKGNPLDGGWYDAGDYIKFGMNLSYTIYCLLKGYDVFPNGYDNKYDWTYKSTDAIPDILNEAKFATDYMIKAIIDANTIVLDVGVASVEHSNLGVANDPDGRSDSEIRLCTGADIPATYAACLALMSTLYRKYNETYADKCLEKAKSAFAFAKNKIASGGDVNLFCDPQLKNGAALYDYPKTNGNYNSSRKIEDRMVAAGVELYRATKDGDPIYKAWAKKNIPGQYNCMGYAFIGPLASFEVWRQGLGDAGVLVQNVNFILTKVQTTGTFANVYQNTDWGTARDVGTAAFEFALAYVVTQDFTTREKFKQYATNHIDWVAGYIGARSYVCGFNGGPQNAHYRTTQWKAVPGGVVSGPDANGNWADDGMDPNYDEVAIDYNAGIIGAVAFLKALDNPGDDIQIKSAFSATPSSVVDFNKTSVNFKATLSKSTAWKINISGAYGSKAFSGTGNSISGTWDGSADKGFFLAGETAVASLTIDGNIAVYDLLNASPLQISISGIKKLASNPDDKLVDDFEVKDPNLANKINGKWIPIGTKTGIAGTTAKIDTASGSNVLKVTGAVTTNDNKNYAGIKTTFNSAGTPVNISSIKSIIFDLKGVNKAANLRVELGQPSISDSAFYNVEVPFTTSLNRYRLNIADFAQPSWKTTANSLDLTNITSLRFTVYDSTGTIIIIVDNVAIEGLGPLNVIASASRLSHSALKPVILNGSIAYNIPQNAIGALDIAIYNMAGKMVMKHTVKASAGKPVSVSLSNLPSGMYTVVNSMNGKVIGEKLKLIYTR